MAEVERVLRAVDLGARRHQEHRTTLTHLAEVVQVPGFPRADGTEELSKGSATRENVTV